MSKIDDMYVESDELDDILQHFGVKGQKWGVATRGKSAGKGKGKKNGHDDYGKRNGTKVEVGKVEGQKIQKSRMAKRVGAAVGINEALAIASAPLFSVVNPIVGTALIGARLGVASGVHAAVQRKQTAKAKDRMEKVLNLKMKDMDMKSVKNFRKVASRYGQIKVKKEGGKWIKINT